jgi:hypothetical protein
MADKKNGRLIDGNVNEEDKKNRRLIGGSINEKDKEKIKIKDVNPSNETKSPVKRFLGAESFTGIESYTDTKNSDDKSKK